MKKLITILSLATYFSMHAQVPTYVPSNGLTSWWPFTGNANDVSGNGNNGIASNATLTSDRFGNPNAAYNFSGNGNITAALSGTLSGDWSISGWYYKTGTSNYNAEYFLSFGNTPNGNGLGFGGSYNMCEPGYFSLYDGAGSGPCFAGDNLLSSSCNVIYGQWQHMVMVKSASTYSIYCNAVLAASGSMLSMSMSQVIMGMRADNQFNFNGYIDDIGVWNRVLDSTEIVGLYNNVPACSSNFTYTTSTNGQVNFIGDSSGVYTTWTFGDDSISNSISPSHIYLQNGIYKVQELIKDSSNTILCSASQTIAITNAACNAASPQVNYTLTANAVPHWWDIYVGYSSQVVNATWYWGDGSSSTGFYPNHVYDSAGVYNICITVFNSCGDSANYCQQDSIYRSAGAIMTHVDVINSTAGIHSLSTGKNNINIYPNPSTGNFVVETNETQNLQILDVSGNIVFSQIISGKTTIDASILAEGIYNLNISDANSITNKRLVIAK